MHLNFSISCRAPQIKIIPEVVKTVFRFYVHVESSIKVYTLINID